MKITKPDRESWETAAGFSARAEYIGREIKARLEQEAQANTTLDDKRIDAIVRSVRTASNRRWLLRTLNASYVPI